MKIYADKLKQLRADCGVRQKELAKHLGVTPTALSYWEGNKTEPPMEMQKKIADYFGVSIDYMMSTDEEISEKNMTESERKWKTNFMKRFAAVV